MKTNAYNTFWQIIENTGIEIPHIQRDYALGRKISDVSRKRKKFLDNVLSALKESRYLRLDFVYGKIYGEKNVEEQRKNEHAIHSLLQSVINYADSIDLIVHLPDITKKSNEEGKAVYLIPLDGQQRLTTLFLIHWYILKCIDQNSTDIEKLKRFRYKTRKSTELFIEFLCDKNLVVDFSGELSEQIENSEKFSNTWKADPTVKSMLVVLDEINRHLKNEGKTQFELLWNNLTQKNLIFFDFLNLQNFSLSDDLYVKMNARGKALTDFENFKAWLFGKIEEDGTYEEWEENKHKFDVKWNDVFWNNKQADQYDVDDAFYNFFKLVYLIDVVGAAQINQKKSSFENDNERDLIENLRNLDSDFDFEAGFRKAFFKGLSNYFKLLDQSDKFISLRDNNAFLADYFKFFFNSSKAVSWTDLLQQNITREYLVTNSERFGMGEHFHDYYRVMRNLFRNQTFDSPRVYSNAIRSVKIINQYLSDKDQSIWDWLFDPNLDTKKYVFTDDQLREEIRKANLINKDNQVREDHNSWWSLITFAEEHEYFQGKINFLLNLSKENKEKFVELYEKISPLFCKNILSHEKSLLQRSLAVFGDYTIAKDAGKRSLIKSNNSDFRDRRENWFGFLTDERKLSILTSLVNDKNYDVANLETSLLKIIEDYIKKNPIDNEIQKEIKNTNWLYFYIYNSKMFKYGDEKLLQFEKGRYAYQLNKTSTGGYFKDVICQFVKHEFYSEADEVLSQPVMGWNNNPSIKYNEENIIRFDNQLEKYILEDESSGKKLNEFNSLSEIINQIKYNR